MQGKKSIRDDDYEKGKKSFEDVQLGELVHWDEDAGASVGDASEENEPDENEEEEKEEEKVNTNTVKYWMKEIGKMGSLLMRKDAKLTEFSMAIKSGCNKNWKLAKPVYDAMQAQLAESKVKMKANTMISVQWGIK